MFKVYPWKMSSEGAKLLGKVLGAPVTQTTLRRGDVVINWGAGYAELSSFTVINNPRAVCVAVNKISTFDALKKHKVPHMPYTREKEYAQQWLRYADIYARKTAEGCNGAGLTIYKKGTKIPIHEEYYFYVMGFPTDREFRINVAFGGAIDVVEKKWLRDSPPAERGARVGDDWMYCKNGIASYPEGIKKAATKAVAACGLDFGGVDIGITKDGDVAVFEVNSAPWLGQSTAIAYAKAFMDRFPEDV